MTDREMLGRWMVLRLGREEVMRLTDNADRNAECAMGYVYVDRVCGMTLNVEAWCDSEAEPLRITSRPSERKQIIVLRYDYFVDKEKRLLDANEIADLHLPTFPDWLKHYTSEGLAPLRALTLIDPLRAPGFPDDIKCLLFDRDGGKESEWVWARLVRQPRQGLFVCKLLNEPFQDFGLHGGELICVDVSEHPEGLISVCLGKASAYGLS